MTAFSRESTRWYRNDNLRMTQKCLKISKLISRAIYDNFFKTFVTKSFSVKEDFQSKSQGIFGSRGHFAAKMTVFFMKMGHTIGNRQNFRQKCLFCIKTGPKIMMDPSHHKVTTNINGSPFSCKVSRISRDFSLQVFKNRKILLMRSAFINASKITPCIKHGYGRPP